MDLAASDPFESAESLAVFDQPGSVWNRLALATSHPDPFSALTPWQLSFREAMDAEHLVLVRQGDEGLVQMAVLRLGQTFCLGPMESSWLFGCNVLGPGGVDVLEATLAEPALRTLDLHRRVIVSGLDPVGVLLRDMRRRLGGRYDMRPIRADEHCAASLDGGMDGFLSRRSTNFRKNLRRVVREAEREGIVIERHQPASAEEAYKVFSRMLAIEDQSWKARFGEEAIFWIDFYSALLRRLSASADGRVMIATRDGRDLAYIFGGMAGGVYRGQQFSFDEQYRRLSLGNVLQHAQIGWLCEQGGERYHMGPSTGDLMAYKAHWTEETLPMTAWLLSA